MKQKIWNLIEVHCFFAGSSLDMGRLLMDLSPTFADFLKTVNSSAPSLFAALERAAPNPSVVGKLLFTAFPLKTTLICDKSEIWENSNVFSPFLKCIVVCHVHACKYAFSFYKFWIYS